jgi:hypothetical protein
MRQLLAATRAATGEPIQAAPLISTTASLALDYKLVAAARASLIRTNFPVSYWRALSTRFSCCDLAFLLFKGCPPCTHTQTGSPTLKQHVPLPPICLLCPPSADPPVDPSSVLRSIRCFQRPLTDPLHACANTPSFRPDHTCWGAPCPDVPLTTLCGQRGPLFSLHRPFS